MQREPIEICALLATHSKALAGAMLMVGMGPAATSLTSPMGTASIARSYCTAPSRPCSRKTWSVSSEKSTASPSKATRSGVLGACTSCWKTSAAETPVGLSKVGLVGERGNHHVLGAACAWAAPLHASTAHPTLQMSPEKAVWLGSPSKEGFRGGHPSLSKAGLFGEHKAVLLIRDCMDTEAC